MAIGENHASHIREVVVRFFISGRDLNPAAVTAALGIDPDVCALQGEPRRLGDGRAVGVESDGYWSVGSGGKVVSKDVNDHFRHLLALLLPRADAIVAAASGGETFFDVRWESTYLYAGTGPLLDAECVAGVARLGAGMGFDIYQIDEPGEG